MRGEDDIRRKADEADAIEAEQTAHQGASAQTPAAIGNGVIQQKLPVIAVVAAMA